MADEEIPVYGDGLQVRDWIFVEDHCRGIDLIIQKGRLGETYILGGDGEQSNIWVIRELLRILGKPESLIVHVGDRKGHDRRYAMDYSKARKELGFAPEKDFTERLKDTVRWYTEHKEWWLPLKDQADKIAEKYLADRMK